MPRKKEKYPLRKREPNGSLYTLCKPIHEVEDWQPFVVELCRRLLAEGLEGLSANQLGVNRQVFTTNVKGDVIRVFINPILYIEDYDMDEVDEECGSRTIAIPRMRHAHVRVDALNYSGEQFILDTSEFSPAKLPVATRLSARIQHEMEHMFGLCTKTEPSAEQTALADLLEQPVPWPSDPHTSVIRRVHPETDTQS